MSKSEKYIGIPKAKYKLVPEKIQYKKPWNPWKCKKNKGLSHVFTLDIGWWYVGQRPTIEEYYEKHDRDMEHWRMPKIFQKSRYWKCIHCGKKAYDYEGKQDKRIRNNLA